MDNFVKNNKELVLLILTWVTLIFYMCLKLFFGYYVEYATSNENFINFCTFVDNSTILGIILPTITSYIMFNIYYCTILSKKNLNNKQRLLVVIVMFVSVIICEYLPTISPVTDIIKFFILPTVLYISESDFKLKFVIVLIIGFIINTLLQAISLFSRNITLHELIQESSFMSLLLSLDIILMLALHYFYERRIKFVGLWLGKWFGQEISWLKSQREKKLKRIEKLQKEVKEIDAEITRQENEN